MIPPGHGYGQKWRGGRIIGRKFSSTVGKRRENAAVSSSGRSGMHRTVTRGNGAQEFPVEEGTADKKREGAKERREKRRKAENNGK